MFGSNFIITSNSGSQETNTSGANYGGKVADTTAYIKQFTTSSSYVNWIYKTMSGIKYITPSTQNDVYLPKNVLIEGNLKVNGTIVSPSDISLKDNINDLTDNLCDNILKINPKKYTFKADENKKERYGVIAQELEEYFPELVTNIHHNDDKTKITEYTEITEYEKCGIVNSNNIKMVKSVNYLELIPVMIVKMKKMQKEIDELKTELKQTRYTTIPRELLSNEILSHININE